MLLLLKIQNHNSISCQLIPSEGAGAVDVGGDVEVDIEVDVYAEGGMEVLTFKLMLR